MVTNTTQRYGLLLDLIYKNGVYYAFQVTNDYKHFAIIKYDAISGASKIVAEDYVKPSYAASGLIKIISDGTIVHELSICRLAPSVSDWTYESCNFKTASIN